VVVSGLLQLKAERALLPGREQPRYTACRSTASVDTAHVLERPRSGSLPCRRRQQRVEGAEREAWVELAEVVAGCRLELWRGGLAASKAGARMPTRHPWFSFIVYPPHTRAPVLLSHWSETNYYCRRRSRRHLNGRPVSQILEFFSSFPAAGLRPLAQAVQDEG